MSETNDFPVVGIGASAGGLDAYKRLLTSLPTDSGAAFILIQHLDPNHESMMADLLGRHTEMRVLQAENDMALEPDTVYVIPPGKFIRLIDHGLFLDNPVQEKGVRLSVDYFFRSLAEVRGERAIGIILSGTGSDGTLGVREIKAAGGMVMVQDPEEAEYDGMPRSAVATGLVDFTVPISKMGNQLVQFLAHPYLDRDDEVTGLSDAAPDAFRTILGTLKNQTGYDFQSYKKGTVERRIQRRMGIKHAQTLDDYLEHLDASPEEVNYLFRDLLIGVTRFFRDEEAWEAFAETVIDPMIAEKPKRGVFRAWVPGCATGEEAYTLAMVVADRADRQNRQLDLQVFATDLNDRAIDSARAGRYPGSVAGDIPEALRSKFMIEDGEFLRVNKRLREGVVFATQNVIADPPFSKLDVITCRNLMIYLEGNVQKRMIEMFHFALAQNGHLFLGSSESAERPGRLFAPVDKSNRIYRKRDVPGAPTRTFPILSGGQKRGGRNQQRSDTAAPETPPSEVARKRLLERFAPAAVLVDQKLEIQYFNGPVRNYLDFPSGEPSNDLPHMAIDGLKGKLRTVLNSVSGGKRTASSVAQHVRREGKEVSVQITAEIVPDAGQGEEYYLVSFEDTTDPEDADQASEARRKAREDAPPEYREAVEALEYELHSTREDLQSTIEEMETSNEELKASNEEVMSMNEELQSTNEELETSREELQSLNEELSTVNSQLEDKVEEVEGARNDLANLLKSTNIAVIFLDTDLLIRWFTPSMADVMRIIEADIGRPVEDIAPRVRDKSLLSDARQCLKDLGEVEAEVDTEDGRFLVRRLRPYRTSENRIEGIVVTYTDVTTLRKAHDATKRREGQQKAVAELGRLALSTSDLQQLCDQSVKELATHLGARFCKILKLEPDGQELRMISGTGWKKGLVGNAAVENGVGSQAGYTLIRSTPVVVENFAEEKRFTPPPLLSDHGIICGASVIIGPVARPWGVLGVHESELGRCPFDADDVHFMLGVANVLWLAISQDAERKRIERDARRMAELTDALPIKVSIVDPDLRYTLVNASYARDGFEPSKLIGQRISAVLGDAFASVEPRLKAALAGEAQEYDLTLNLPDGSLRHEIVRHVPRHDESGEVTSAITVAIDITNRRKLEEQLRRSHEMYRTIGETIPFGVWVTDPDGRLVYVSQSFLDMVGKSFEEARDLGWADMLENGAEETLAAWNECREKGGDWEWEHRFLAKDGKVVHVLALGRPVRDETGAIVNWVGLNLDITDRKEEEERLETVSAELDHRVKNLLATVSTLARMTGRSAKSLSDYRESLEARIQALSQTHQLLAESNWSGMEIEALLRLELEPYSGHGDGVEISGPKLLLKPRAAQSLVLAFHELTTNAAKYGALSVPSGRLSVNWQIEHRSAPTAVLTWVESGLPEPPEPGKPGFGTTLTTSLLAAQLDATTKLDLSEDGLVYRLELPASNWTHAWSDRIENSPPSS